MRPLLRGSLHVELTLGVQPVFRLCIEVGGKPLCKIVRHRGATGTEALQSGARNTDGHGETVNRQRARLKEVVIQNGTGMHWVGAAQTSYSLQVFSQPLDTLAVGLVDQRRGYHRSLWIISNALVNCIRIFHLTKGVVFGGSKFPLQDVPRILIPEYVVFKRTFSPASPLSVH